MHFDTAKVLTLGVLAALAALAANRSVAIYHDGVRTSIRDLWTGEQTRRQMARYAYGISFMFVVAYALPFTLLTGVLVMHIVLLGADVIGVGARTVLAATMSAFLYGGLCAYVADLTTAALSSLPRVASDVHLLWQPLTYAVVFLPAVAAGHQFGRRHGLIFAVATAMLWISANALINGEPLSGAMPGGLIAASLSTIAVLVVAWRVPTDSTPDLDYFDDKITRIRRHWPYLLPGAALIAFAGHRGWLAGDPLQVAMLATDQAWAAAFVAVFTVVGMFPVQGMTGLVSGVWNEDGYPDWSLAVGYVSPNPVVAAFAGVGVMAFELASLRRVAHVLTRRPGITGLGHAARDALDTVGEVGILAGAVLAAAATAGPFAAGVVIAAQAFNEAQRRPIMPVAVPVFAYVAVAASAAVPF